MVFTRNKLKNNIFLLLATICILAALGYYLFLKIKHPEEITHDYHSGLQIKIENQIENSENTINQYRRFYKAGNSNTYFDAKLINTNPVFIFNNKKIVFWSNNRSVPSFDEIKNIKSEEVKKLNENIELVVRRHEIVNRDTIDYVSLITLFSSYRTNNEYLKSNYNSEIFNIAPEKISKRAFTNSAKITNINKQPLFFYKVSKKSETIKSSIPNSLLWFFNITILLISLHVLTRVVKYFRIHSFGIAFTLLLSYLVGLRFFMVFTGILFLFITKILETLKTSLQVFTPQHLSIH